MFHKSSWSIFTAAVILALLVSAFPPGAVRAEGENPAPTDPPPAQESVTAEAPAPAATEEVQPPVETAAPTEAATEVPTEEPATQADTQAPTVEEVIAQAPEGVVVVPVDSAGQALPMAEEATAKAYVTGDPVYCKGSAGWGDITNCFHHDTLEEALKDADNYGSGTIYVAVDYTDLNPAPVVIDGSTWLDAPSWLNLIGGVDIVTGEVTGKTVLNRPIVVSNLLNFRMENFSIIGVGNTLPNSPDIASQEITTPVEAALTISQSDITQIVNSDISDNTVAGINIQANRTVNLVNVQANNNGAGNLVVQNGGLDIMSSKFNNNFGTGLTAYTDGILFVTCSEARNNSGADYQYPEIGGGGMYLKSGGDPTLRCNKITGNSSYGLIMETDNQIFTGSNTISGNKLFDFVPLTRAGVTEQYMPCSEMCPNCKGNSNGSGEEEKPAEGNTQVVIVNVGDQNSSTELKGGYAIVFKLMEQQDGREKEIQRTILASGSAPDGSTGVYTPLDESELPAPFGQGTTFMPYAFNLAITNPDGSPLESLVGYMFIRFYLPDGFVLPGGMRLVIQHFDQATSSWTPMSTGEGGGMAYTYANKPGTYALTMVPIK